MKSDFIMVHLVDTLDPVIIRIDQIVAVWTNIRNDHVGAKIETDLNRNYYTEETVREISDLIADAEGAR